jgi:hypothetical protein
MAIGQAPNFQAQSDLLAYCVENPTLEAGYAPMGQTNAQVLPCTEWPGVLPPTSVSVTGVASPTTANTCLQFFGASEPCVGPIGQYTLLVLVALGFGVFWFAGRKA